MQGQLCTQMTQYYIQATSTEKLSTDLDEDLQLVLKWVWISKLVLKPKALCLDLILNLNSNHG